MSDPPAETGPLAPMIRRESPWLHQVRVALAIVAGLGVLACWWVALALWQDWDSAPGPAAYLVQLGGFTMASAAIVCLAILGPRLAAVPLAVLLLVWGWLGTWAYGFLWVPGFVAVVSCVFPRPPGGLRLKRGVAPA